MFSTIQREANPHVKSNQQNVVSVFQGSPSRESSRLSWAVESSKLGGVLCEAPHCGFPKPSRVFASTLHVSSSRLDVQAGYSSPELCRPDEIAISSIPAFRRNVI